VIEKALVSLDSPAYQQLTMFHETRDVIADDFVHPGPIQFFGDALLTHGIPETVRLNQGYAAGCFDLGR